MSNDRQENTILKNLKEKVEAMTYSPEGERGNTWITLKGKRYAVWIAPEMEIYPGSTVEHLPYVDKRPNQEPILATKIVKIQ